MRFWTGPCSVAAFAAKFREAGLRVTCEGTESVWAESEGEDDIDARLTVERALKAAHGTDFGLRPNVTMRLKDRGPERPWNALREPGEDPREC